MRRFSLFLIPFILIFCQFGTAQAKIVAAPECVVFFAVESGNSPVGQNFKISNGAEGQLDYTLSYVAPWFNLDKTSGSLSGGFDTINVAPNSSGLTKQQSPYVGDITITNNADPEDKKIVKVRLSIIGPETYAKAYAYDQNGNLTRRVTPNGDIIDYEYDKLNRLTYIYYPDGSTVSYTYDDKGNRTTMEDNTGVATFEYDGHNRLTAAYFPNINPVIYSYDKSGNIVRIEYPDQSAVNYAYNSDNKLINVIDSNGTTNYSYYNDTGLLHTKTLPNNVITTYVYDGAKRVTDVDNRGPGGALISAYHYIYDPNGNITSSSETTTDGTKITTYIYDKLNRLKTVTYPDERGTVTYAYDAAGNRLTMITPQGTTNYKYDADNRLLRAGKEIFFYDKAGNLIKRVSPEKTITCKYDYDNRLIEHKDDTQTVTFEYDGDGRRIAKTVNGRRTNYVNDILRSPYQVILEADANWHVTKLYRYGLDRLSQEEF